MISRVTVRGFRGVSGTQVFAPEVLTILTGRNGLGKTTFFDAIDWCLFGDASRFGSQTDVIKNLYVAGVGPFVEVIVTLGGRTVAIARAEHSLTLDGSPISQRELAEALIVDPDVFPPYLRDLGQQVRTVSYLAQDQIRSFVTASLTSERRALLRGLLGVPNAGLVESSIKRIRDHFAAREKQLIQQIDERSTELHQLATGVAFDPTADHEAQEFVSRFREQYGADGDVDTLAALRPALDSALSQHQNTEAILESVLVAHAETVTTVAQVRAELDSLETRRRTLLERSGELEVTARDGTTSIDKALTLHEEAVRDFSGAEASVIALSQQLLERQRVEALTKDLANWDSERNKAVERVAEARVTAESLSLELRNGEALADEHQRQVKLAQERTAIESRRTELVGKLNGLEAELRDREANLARIELAQSLASANVAHALAAKDSASASQERFANAARRAAQIADLREQLLTFLDSTDSHCPFCGADYETHDQLLRHVTVTTSGSDVDMRLHDATATLRATEAKWVEASAAEKRQLDLCVEHRAALEQLKQDISQLRIQNESLGTSLAALGHPIQLSTSSDVFARVNELRARSDAADRSLVQPEEQLHTINNKRTQISAELARLNVTEMNITAAIVADVEGRLSDARKRATERAESLQRLRTNQATVESALSDVRSQIAGLEGRVNAEQERKRRVLDEFEQQCESAGITFSAAVETLGNEIERRAKDVRVAIAATRDAIARATSIERRQLLNESVAKQRNQRKQLAEAEQSLSVLRQAQNRFQLIAHELETRSRIEADAAGSQHRAAIQECVNDLYPHAHLNEVDVDFANGELLVKDRWLATGVRPEDYSSTGQANVLALSVFLGLALRQTFSLGRFLLLDEPIQNLDDLHFLAFLTLVKRVALSRQVIMSTADANVAEVLRRQLRSWSVVNRNWCEYEWVAFDPQKGPTIRRHEGRQIAVA